MPIKTTMGYGHTTTRTKTENAIGWWGFGAMGTGRSINHHNHFGKPTIPTEVEHTQIQNLAIPLLVIYTTEVF